MKKLFYIFLAIAMLVSVSACGRNNDAPAPNAGNVTQAPAEIPTEIPTEEPTMEPTAEPSAVPTQEPDPVTQEPVDPVQNVFSGDIIDGVYINEFIGVRLEIPASWTALSREQLLESMGIVSERLTEAELAEALASVETVIDLSASSAMASSIQVQLINLSANPLMQTMTPEQIVALVMEIAEQTFIESGMEIEMSVQTSYQVAGEAYVGVDLFMNMMGIEVSERILFRMLDDYMVQIVLAVSSLDANVTLDQLQATILPL